MFWYKLDNRYIQPMLLHVQDGHGTESWEAVKTSFRVWLRRRSCIECLLCTESHSRYKDNVAERSQSLVTTEEEEVVHVEMPRLALSASQDNISTIADSKI